MNKLLFFVVGMCFMLNHAAAQNKHTMREKVIIDFIYYGDESANVGVNIDLGKYFAISGEYAYLTKAPTTNVELTTYKGNSFIGEVKFYPFGEPFFLRPLPGRKGSMRRSWWQSQLNAIRNCLKNPCRKCFVNPLRGLALSGGYAYTQHRMQVAGYNDTTYDFTLNNRGAFVGLSYTIRIERFTLGVRNRWTLDRPVLNNPDGTQETVNRRWGIRSLSVPGAFIGFNF